MHHFCPYPLGQNQAIAPPRQKAAWESRFWPDSPFAAGILA